MCFELRSVLSDGISARAVASVSACAHATSSLVAHAFISARMEESATAQLIVMSGHGAPGGPRFARRPSLASGTAAMAPRDHPNSSGGRAASAARGRHLDECERTTALGELRGVLLVSPQLSPQRPAPTTDGRGSRSRGSCSASRHYVFPGHLLQSKSARDDPRAGCCGPAVRHVTSSPSLAPPMAHSQVLELLH